MARRWSVRKSLAGTLVLILGGSLLTSVANQTRPLEGESSATEVHQSIRHDSSAPLREIGIPITESETKYEDPSDEGDSPGLAPTEIGDPDKDQPQRERFLPRPKIVRSGPDRVAQRSEFPSTRRSPFAPSAPTTGTGFDSIGDTYPGFNVNSAPPDTSMAVGPTQIMVMVNAGLLIQDKSGEGLLGPVASKSIWSGFGGDCQNQNDGDGIVRYDRLADRWIISQFAVDGSGFYECIAVSKTSDATGAYWRYAFSFSDFPDYPKLSVWPDAYYITYNMFDGVTGDWSGGKVCATDREAMLVGDTANQICRSSGLEYGGLLAADVDSGTPPPDNAPNTIVALGYYNDELAYWTFKPNFDDLTAAFNGPTAIPIASYFPACYVGGVWGYDCISQSGTATGLDSLDDRLMNRLAYRNFGTHQSLVVTHAVRDGSTIGVRWYELRMAAGSPIPSVYQQGTYVPDSSSRWMSSAAQNRDGDIAIGYSVSSNSMFPSIAITGRLANDDLGTLTQGETIVKTGGGSQTGSLTRWGDYSTMNIDPADDCTFWFATEYLPASGTFNWATFAQSFTLDPCEAEPVFDFDLDLSDDAVTVAPGASTEVDITSSTTTGTTETLSFDVDGLPAGMTASFSPTELDEDGSTTLELSASGSVTPGTYSLDITATATGGTAHTVTLDITVTDFNIALTSASGSTTPGGTLNTNLQSTLVTGYRQNLNLTASDLPAGVRVTFGRTRIASGARTTVRIATSASTPPGEHEITITAAGTNYSISKTYTLTVSDFSVGRSPTTITIAKGTSSTVTISTAVTEGVTQPVNLSLVRPPSRVTGRFSATRVNAGNSSTLTISVGSAARAGTYTLTISARGTTVTKTTTVSLTITA